MCLPSNCRAGQHHFKLMLKMLLSCYYPVIIFYLAVPWIYMLNCSRISTPKTQTASKELPSSTTSYGNIHENHKIGTKTVLKNWINTQPDYTTSSSILPNNTLRNVTVDELMSPEFECEPFKSFYLDCNTCWCSENGKEANLCTRKACDAVEYPSLDQQEQAPRQNKTLKVQSLDQSNLSVVQSVHQGPVKGPVT